MIVSPMNRLIDMVRSMSTEQLNAILTLFIRIYYFITFLA